MIPLNESAYRVKFPRNRPNHDNKLRNCGKKRHTKIQKVTIQPEQPQSKEIQPGCKRRRNKQNEQDSISRPARTGCERQEKKDRDRTFCDLNFFDRWMRLCHKLPCAGAQNVPGGFPRFLSNLLPRLNILNRSSSDNKRIEGSLGEYCGDAEVNALNSRCQCIESGKMAVTGISVGLVLR